MTLIIVNISTGVNRGIRGTFLVLLVYAEKVLNEDTLNIKKSSLEQDDFESIGTVLAFQNGTSEPSPCSGIFTLHPVLKTYILDM